MQHISYRLVKESEADRPASRGGVPWSPAHSPVRNWYRYLSGRMGVDDHGMTDTAGAERPTPMAANAWDVRAAAFNDNYGILLGSGDFPYGQYAEHLYAKYPNGVDPNQLLYLSATTANWIETVTTEGLIVQRTIRNDSPAVLEALEMGLFTTYGGNYFLIIRDVFPAQITIPISVPLLAQYLFQTSYS